MKFSLIFIILISIKVWQVSACKSKEIEKGRSLTDVGVVNENYLKSDGQSKALSVFPSNLARSRRRNNTMMLVLMGIVVFLMFFVTIGFQFLATFGGKSFLMAKLALLLASINGLKRIASQGVHYGLYHAPDPAAAHPYYAYERFDPRKI